MPIAISRARLSRFPLVCALRTSRLQLPTCGSTALTGRSFILSTRPNANIRGRSAATSPLSLDSETVAERVRLVGAAARYLQAYEERVREFDRAGGALRDQAYEAERWMRVLLKCGLKSLNDLAESENMLAWSRDAAADSFRPDQAPAVMEKVQNVIQDLFEDDWAFLDRAGTVVQRHCLGVERCGE